MSTEAATLTFRLPWPPSANRMWRHGPRGSYLTAKGREFREEAIGDVLRQLGTPLPIVRRCRVMLELTPPDKRQRDADNHIKAVLDSIVHSGLLEDDSRDYIKEVRAEWTDLVEPPGCCDVTLREVGDE